MLKIKTKIKYFLIFLLTPAFALAEKEEETELKDDNINSLKELIERFVEIIEFTFPVLAGVALAFFLYGLVDFIANADNEQKRIKGKNLMTWGVVALFVMVSMWGLVNMLHNTFF